MAVGAPISWCAGLEGSIDELDTIGRESARMGKGLLKGML